MGLSRALVLGLHDPPHGAEAMTLQEEAAKPAGLRPVRGALIATSFDDFLSRLSTR